MGTRASIATLAVALGGCALAIDASDLRAGTSLAYENAVAADTPIDFYTMHDPAGSPAPANAVTASQDTATMQGASLTGSAASFDGAAAINLGEGYDFTGTASYSLEAWVQQVALDGPTAVLFEDGTLDEDTGAKYGYDVTLTNTESTTTPGDLVGGFGRSAGASSSCGIAFDYPPTSGFYLAAVYDGTQLTVYVDGAVAGQGCGGAQSVTLASPMQPSDSTLWLGADPNGDEGFSGLVSEVAIYAVPLMAQQVSTHYMAGQSGP